MSRILRFRHRHFAIETLLLIGGLLFAWHMLTYIPAQDMRVSFAYWWEGVVAKSGVVLVASAPVAAVGGAVAGARLRSGDIQKYFGPRTRFGIAWNALWPTLTVAAIIQIFALVYYFIYAGKPQGHPNPQIVVAYIAVICFHMLFGFYLGLKINWLIAIPVALLVSLQILSQSGATEDFRLRYISGYFLYGCCSIYEVMPSWAYLPAVIFNAGGALALCIAALIELKAASFLLRLVTLCMVPVTIVALFFGAASTAKGAQAFPAMQRPGITCFRNAPEICVYPGQDANRYIVMTVIKTWTVMHKLGLDIPNRVSFTAWSYNPPEIPLVIYPDTGKGHVIWGFILNSIQLTGTPDKVHQWCQFKDDGDEANLNRSTLISFMLEHLTKAFPNVEMPPRDLPAETARQVAARLKLIHAMTPKQQTAWANAALSANRDCTPLPVFAK